MIKSKSEKIIVALSGGIDSAVAAALLKEAGFNVIGIFMRFWPQYHSRAEYGAGQNRCCLPGAEVRARKVAKILKIPFYVLIFEKEFKKRIIDYFLREYKAGRTPNPCVVCNKEIKFGLLMEKALRLNANFVATGHYARLREQRDRTSLIRGRDKNKDQSYFLWQLNQNQLKHILFPVGGYTKGEVRKLAKKFKLPVLDIPESMEVCFIKTSLNDFLSRYIKPKIGKIVTNRGKIIGKHQDLCFYTIGQRKGIKLPGGPYYVLNKNKEKNILIVTKKKRDLFNRELVFKSAHWISGKKPKLPLKIKAKIRYRHRPAFATITKKLEPRSYKLIFEKSQRAITPGQSVVFYKRQEVLGGGVICKT